MKVRCYVPQGVTATRIWNDTVDITSANGYVDVSVVDASELCARGWTKLDGAYVGATGERPVEPQIRKVGATFIDTTTSQVLKWNGNAWFDVVTGTEVA